MKVLGEALPSMREGAETRTVTWIELIIEVENGDAH